MKTFAEERMRKVFEVASRASNELQREEYARSLQSFKELTGRLRGMQLSSAWAVWGTAVNLDQLGDHAMAFEAIQDSLRQDPLSPISVRSFEVISQRIREAVQRAAPTDLAIERLYELVRRVGEADVPTHLAMVRHLCAVGALERADALAEAVTTLAPVSRDAWRARAEVARLRRDDVAAASFEAEAKLRALDEVPYAPGTRKGLLE